jgi:hypothetical protein
MLRFSSSHKPTFITTLCLAIVFSIGLLPLMSVEAAGTIQGTVFRDFNGNSQRDGANELGVAGVTVTAYDAAGVVQGTTTTAANGSYSLSAGGAGPYRIEFTNLPNGYFPSMQANTSLSTVRFVNDGATSNVDLGVNHPEDYSQDNPRIVVPLNQTGNHQVHNRFGLVSQEYDLAIQEAVERHDLSLMRSGAIWGVAYDRESKQLYTSAHLKRYSEFGTSGIGGVYVLDYTDPLTATFVGEFSLQGVTPQNGGPAIDLGSVTRSHVPGAISAGAAGDNQITSNPYQRMRDLDAFAKVGTMAYGDIELGPNAVLWLVNLNQRALITVDATVPVADMPATANQYPILTIPGAPSCTGGELRPWALKFYRELGYLGVVCDAGTSQNAADLRAYVLSFDPTDLGAGFTTTLEIPLNYTREAAEHAQLSPGAIPIREDSRWKPWAYTWNQVITGTSSRISHAQPILSGIDFDATGSMVIGLSNRFAEQSGYNQYVPVSGSTTQYTINNAGDILHACLVGGSYVLEGSAACPVNDTGLYGLTTDGFANNGEYYWGDAYVKTNPLNNVTTTHLEIANGAVALQPARNEVISTAFDPSSPDAYIGLFGQGLIFLNSSTGALERGWQIDNLADPSLYHYGKGNALGDIELLFDPAPLEIGNRVWVDANDNGVQDPGETPLAGVTVTLHDSTGAQIAQTITDANGNYLFNDNNVLVGLLANTNYSVRIDETQAALSNYRPAQLDTGSNLGSADLRDSDGDPGLYPSAVAVNLTTGGPGQNNHNFDFGFVEIFSLGNLVWEDQNNNGVVDPGEPGIPNVTVHLYADANGDGVPDSPVPLATQTTNPSGNYLFTNLAAGSYLVEIVPPTGYKTSTGQNNSLTGPYEPAPGPNNDIDNDDNGTLVGSVIRSGTVTLSSGAEPVNDGDTNANSNLTVDFGLYRPASLGDYVWHDANDNGQQDRGESPVAGVTVTLYDGTGTPIATTTTDVNGYYIFDNLIPGPYSVGFSNLPPEYPRFASWNVGNDASDSDADPSTGRTHVVTLAPGEHNPTLDAGILANTPTAVQLLSFTATQNDQGVAVAWKTASEKDTMGFAIWRSADGTRENAVRVNSELIVAKGANSSYSWLDREAEQGASYSYWLEEIELGGKTHFYGPATVAKQPNASYQVYLPLVQR